MLRPYSNNLWVVLFGKMVENLKNVLSIGFYVIDLNLHLHYFFDLIK